MITRRESGTVTLVSRDNVTLRVDTASVHQIVAQRLELAVRNAGVKIGSDYFNKFFYLHRVNSLQIISDDTACQYPPCQALLGDSLAGWD